MADVIRMKVGDVKLNENNPRIIKDDKFKKLVESIKNFPEMMDIRPIVVNSQMVILGGNMRFKACTEAGWKTVPVIVADNLSEEQEREFLIKDNVSGGEWDFEILDNEWDKNELNEWGLTIPIFEEEENDDNYSRKIEAPIYEIKGEKPAINELTSIEKYKNLLIKISESEISEEEKEFLRLAAARHIVFDYSKIAEFYAHSNKDVQLLMESSALVIIDFDKAIEEGFVKMTKEISEQYSDENDEK